MLSAVLPQSRLFRVRHIVNAFLSSSADWSTAGHVLIVGHVRLQAKFRLVAGWMPYCRGQFKTAT